MNSIVKNSLLKSFQKLSKGTEFVLRTIPQDQLGFKPKPEMRSLGELAFHIATMPVGSVILAESDFKEFPPVEVLVQAMTERIGDVETTNYADIFVRSSKYYEEFISKKTPEELSTGTYQSFLMREPNTYVEGYLSMITHMIQHRGTLHAYLRLLDVPVSMTQYFGIKELKSE